MARKVFVAATGQHSGKTTMSVCLVHLARRAGHRVAFIKPVGQQHVRIGDLDVDKDVALIAHVYGLQEDLPYMSPVVVKSDVTRRAIDGEVRTQDLSTRILHALEKLEQRADVIVVEGTGHGGVGSVFGLNNAQVARLVGAPVVIVSGGGIGKTVDAVELNLALYRQEGAPVGAVIVNKLLPDKRQSVLGYLGRAFETRGLTAVGGLYWSPVLAHPTLNSVARLFGQPLRGDRTRATRIAHNVQLGAASTQRVVDLLNDSTLLVTTSTRDELLVTMSALYNIPAYHERIAGLVITGTAPVSRISQRILDDSAIPYMRVECTSGEAFTTLNEHVSKLTPDDTEKIAHLQAHAEQEIDFAPIERLFA
jgi:BioD-like phosphotransacetylase family protein